MYSYIYRGSQEIWEKIFSTTELLHAYRELGIYFTLIGCFGNDIDKPYLSLIITNDSNTRLNIKAWEIFLDSLQGPYTLDARNFEIVLQESDITLNIYSFLYHVISGSVLKKITGETERLVYSCFKSGTMLTFCTGACTYGEEADWDPLFISPGPIQRVGDAGQDYIIMLNVAGQERRLRLPEQCRFK